MSLVSTFKGCEWEDKMRKFAPILLLLLMAGCTPPSAEKILHASAVSLEAISISANSGVKFVLAVMPANTEQRREILNIFAKIVEVDNRGVTVVKALDGSKDANQVLKAMKPILAEIRGAIDSGLLGIKNPDTKSKAQTYLEAVSASVTAFQVILEVQ
jgi:hypothetical protein